MEAGALFIFAYFAGFALVLWVLMGCPGLRRKGYSEKQVKRMIREAIAEHKNDSAP